MGGNPKGNHMIKPRDVGQPEAPRRQKPQIANNIWNPQTQQQPVRQQPQMGYPMMHQQVMQIQQQLQMGMNVMQIPQMQYGATQQQQKHKKHVSTYTHVEQKPHSSNEF